MTLRFCLRSGFLLLFAAPALLFSQTLPTVPEASEPSAAQPDSAAVSAAPTPAPDPAADSKEAEQRRQNLLLLKWGLEPQIRAFLAEITQSKEASYQEAVWEFSQTHRKSSSLWLPVLEYFSAIRCYRLYEASLDRLRSYSDEDDKTMRAVLRYIEEAVLIGGQPLPDDLGDLLWNLYQYASDLLADRALESFGTLHLTAYLEPLKQEYEDPYGKANLKPTLIRSVGKIGGESVRSWVTEHLKTELSKDDRMAFCEVLAGTGDPEVVDPLMEQMESDNPYLRLKIIDSLQGFAPPLLAKWIAVGLTDDFWRVRQSAVRLCKENQVTQFVPELIFKSKTDPENKIKELCFGALGVLQTDEAFRYLSDLFFDESQSESLRKTALKNLLAFPMERIREPLLEWASEGSHQKSRLFPVLAGALAQKEASGLEPFYELFLAHPSGEVQHAAVVGMIHNRVTVNLPRLHQLYQKNKKNFLGRAIEPLIDPKEAESAAALQSPSPSTDPAAAAEDNPPDRQ